MFLEVYIRSDPRLESLPSFRVILSNHKYAVRRALLKRNFYMLVNLFLIRVSDTYCILITKGRLPPHNSFYKGGIYDTFERSCDYL